MSACKQNGNGYCVYQKTRTGSLLLSLFDDMKHSVEGSFRKESIIMPLVCDYSSKPTFVSKLPSAGEVNGMSMFIKHPYELKISNYGLR